MKRFIYMLAAFALMGAVSCQPDEEVAVHASFTTDKESYDCLLYTSPSPRDS